MKSYFVFLLFILSIFTSTAQVTGELDTNFRIAANGDFDGSVYQVRVLPDDKILAFGPFTRIGNWSSPYLMRFFPDGKVDTSFTSPFKAGQQTFSPDYGIRQGHGVQILPGGRLLLAARFDSVGTMAQKNLAILFPNGQLDTTFKPFRNNPTVGYGSGDALMAYQTTPGHIYADFQTTWGSTLRRFHEDGAIDTGFVVDPLFYAGTTYLWKVTPLKNGLLYFHGYDPCVVCPPDGGPVYRGIFVKDSSNHLNVQESFAPTIFYSGCWLQEDSSDNIYTTWFSYGVPPGWEFFRYSLSHNMVHSIEGVPFSLHGQMMDFSELIIAGGGKNLIKIIHPDTIPTPVPLGSTNSDVQSMARTATNQLYVAGDFSMYQGEPCSRIIRIHNQQTILGSKPEISGSVSLFPNPSAGHTCRLKGVSANGVLSVYTPQGQLVACRTEKMADGSATLTLDNRELKGPLFVHITTGQTAIVLCWILLP